MKQLLDILKRKNQIQDILKYQIDFGEIEKYPLTTLSIGAIEIDPYKIKNILEIGEMGAFAKKKAKQIKGSAFFVDRRRQILYKRRKENYNY